jgi:hypothetical protein
MNDLRFPECCSTVTEEVAPITDKQRILVFQQNGSGDSKTKGIRRYGQELFILEMVSIDGALPSILDSTEEYLPRNISADLVLDFLKHPDLSHDLAAACCDSKIPVVASGKKLRLKGVLTPPT